MIVVDHIHTLIEPPFFADLPSVVKTEDSIIQMYEVSWSYQSHQRKIWRKDVQFFLDVLFNKIMLTILSFECSSLRKPSLPHWKSWRKMCKPELKPRKAFPSDQALQNLTLLLPPLLQLFGHWPLSRLHFVELIQIDCPRGLLEHCCLGFIHWLESCR